MLKKTLLGVGLALSLFGVAACGSADQEASRGATSSATEQQSPGAAGQAPGAGEQPEMPEPDLAGIPEVVAEVNGEQIGKEDFVAAYEGQFQQMAMQAQMAGEDLDQDQLKKQTAENLVGTELLVQEADRRELTATQEQMDSTLDELAQQNGLGSAEEFLNALGEQGMPEDEVRAQLEMQVKLDQLVAEEAGDTAPTEDELRALYDQMVGQQEQLAPEGGEGAETPPFEEMRPQLEQQLRSQKEGEAAQALVGELREGADVTIHV
ncbi:SurA N-terminal domain-containing protein [Georgenia subflava]|uniref:peptidylprolyl isomerase n=1 Tax=Georgenia subflava TaxID=1622177 RepID=A0A6N7EM87_9MICO|nr:SurA N-terminal domain-containing protein [Georgenia subflava]MPV36364.1 peptidylprolyl isomerase [Georgenia subflava]